MITPGDEVLTIPCFVDQLARVGAVLIPSDSNEIAYRAPAGALTATHRRYIQARRAEICAYLRAVTAAERPPLRLSNAAARPSLQQELWWRRVISLPDPLPSERIPVVLHFKDVRRETAMQAVRAIVARHDSLRARFEEIDGRLSVAFNAADEFQIAAESASDWPTALSCAQAFLEMPLRAAASWLFAAKIIEVADAGTAGVVIALLAHHLIFDGGSVEIVTRELTEGLAPAMENMPLKSRRPSLQYRDFAGWERDWFESPAGELVATYWEQWIKTVPALRSPSGRPLNRAPGIRTTYGFDLPVSISSLLEQYCLYQNTTTYIVLSCVFATALSRWSGQTHFAMRSVTDLRASPELAATVGLLVGHDPIEVSLAEPHRFEDLLRRQRVEILSSHLLRLPCRSSSSDRRYENLHGPIGATINFRPGNSLRMSAGREPATTPSWPVAVKQPVEKLWRAHIATIYLSLGYGAGELVGRFNFNGTLLTSSEQDRLANEFLAVLREVVAP